MHCFFYWLIVAEEGNDEASFNSLTDDLENNESKKMINYKHDHNLIHEWKTLACIHYFYNTLIIYQYSIFK